MRTHSIAVAAIVLSLAACSKGASTSPADPANQVITTATFDSSLRVDLKASTVTPSGLYYRDIVVGTGPVAVAGDSVFAGYVGALTDGKQFDASPANQPYGFPLGGHRVIAGWDEGVAGMHVGGKRQLIIPASLGYGPSGSGPIPPNAVLIFTVELARVQ
ncbi:MAG TPA: FKBP-type peptidyl-prolyl cis-trans isomerase [Gemmatimonadales bacterium]|jgi:FKBP-type peptidyl-prolyl cis-trans isomerase